MSSIGEAVGDMLLAESRKREPKLREFAVRSLHEQLRLLYQRLTTERDTGVRIGIIGSQDDDIEDSWMWTALNIPKTDARASIVRWANPTSPFKRSKSLDQQIEAVIAIAAITWLDASSRTGLVAKLSGLN